MNELERLESIIQRDIQSLKNCAPNVDCDGCCEKLYFGHWLYF